MNPEATLTACCAQCGRPAPTDPGELSRWRPSELIAAGELDDLTAAMLLCPECALDDLREDYEAGEAD